MNWTGLPRADPVLRVCESAAHAEPSGPSVVKHRVEMVEFDAGGVGGEAPVDGADGGVALGDPGGDLLFEGVSVRQAAIETLAEDAQFDLGHVQPYHAWGCSGARACRRGAWLRRAGTPRHKEAGVWVLRLSWTRTIFSASG